MGWKIMLRRLSRSRGWHKQNVFEKKFREIEDQITVQTFQKETFEKTMQEGNL